LSQFRTTAQQRSEAAVQRLKDLPLVAAGIGPGLHIQSIAQMDASPVICVVVAAMDGPEELIKRELIRRESFQEQTEGYRDGRSIRKKPWTITTFGLMEEDRVAPPPRSAYLVGTQVSEDDDRLKTHRVGIYRTGVVEWAHRYPRGPVLPATSMADDVHNAFLFAARVFDEAGYSGRLKIWLQIQYAEDAELELPAGWDIVPQRPGVSELDFSYEVTTDQLLADPTPTTRAALDAIWQGFGVDRCALFDGDGNWRS